MTGPFKVATLGLNLACLTIAPAAAQDGLPPCLDPLPEPAAYQTAIEADGWALVTDPATRAEAELSAYLFLHANNFFPDAFATGADVVNFVQSAETALAQGRGPMQIFTRDGTVLGLVVDETYPETVNIVCLLAGNDLPLAAEYQAADPESFDMGAIRIGFLGLPVEDLVSTRAIVSIRLLGPEGFLRILPARDGILTQLIYSAVE